MADYGTVEDVASLTPRYASSDGNFDGTTRPSYAAVTTFLNQVSAMVNSILAEEGFTVPITDTSVTPMFDAFVNQEVAELVEGVNGSGRFGPKSDSLARRTEEGAHGRFSVINADVRGFIKGNRVGIERMGASKVDANEVAEGWFFVSADRQDSYSAAAEASGYTS
jgi:hypothetical protein